MLSATALPHIHLFSLAAVLRRLLDADIAGIAVGSAVTVGIVIASVIIVILFLLRRGKLYNG